MFIITKSACYMNSFDYFISFYFISNLTNVFEDMQTAALLHTAGLSDSRTLPHTAAHCCTLSHSAGQLPTAASTATHYRARCRTRQVHCHTRHVHCRTHPRALLQTSVRTTIHWRTAVLPYTAALPHSRTHCYILLRTPRTPHELMCRTPHTTHSCTLQ